MFLVFNKEKIYAYLVSIVTVIVLFFSAGVFMNNSENIIETSTTVQKKLPIYNVNTDENKIAFTMNCAWNADDIDKILKVLEENNTKITFFMVGDWIDKYPEETKRIYEAGHEIRKS
jgi:peptidoglycan/xylan/chitin deacetylase (PgdA/CDA1 family)